MFTRYALYYTADGAFASLGAAWLGWDINAGQPVAHPMLDGVNLDALTRTPRKYGFHGTIKAPFALAQDMDEAGLMQATQDLCAQLRPVPLDRLQVVAMGRFLALVPSGDQMALRELAGNVVRGLDMFRAPASAQELARRRLRNLSPEQDRNLVQWGYPHVMDQFRFHMTLTGRMLRGELDAAQTAAMVYFAAPLSQPFTLDALTLVGERADGQCVCIRRFALA